MYLINTETLELTSFIDVNVCPKYAILSHRWTDDEVTHKDFVKGRKKDSSGYKKILDFCTLVKQNGLSWAWVDTCCIDKRSSAELQEAINSMFRYYQASKKCYVHLADVNAAPADPDLKTEIQSSKWFTRGWTLQELLAPSRIEFYSSRWRPLGRLGRHAGPAGRWILYDNSPDFRALISQASGVQQDFLAGKNSVFDSSIACRMSWAAGRETTRGEDMAYCLLGLFQVNMPLLYGEGQQKAFMRLQEEIMKTSDDHSLFAWTTTDSLSHSSFCHGMLAEAPSSFARAQGISPSCPRKWSNTDAYTLTSRGMKIVLPVVHLADDVFLAKLDCDTAHGEDRPIILLRKTSNTEPTFQRIFCGANVVTDGRLLRTTVGRWKFQEMCVRQNRSISDLFWSRPEQFFLLDPGKSRAYSLQNVTCMSSDELGKNVVQRARSTSGQGGFLLQSLLSSQATATLSLRYVPMREDLIIEISALSKYFVGYHVHLAGASQVVAPPQRTGAQWDRDDPNDVLKTSATEPLLEYHKTHRLGSTISLLSKQDKDHCHVVTLAIKTIHVYEHTKIYTLVLDWKYERTPDGGCNFGVEGIDVLPPVGFTAEIVQHPPHAAMPWAMVE